MKIKDNNNINDICSIVSDLLPLYIDGACSDDSKQLIEEHMETCRNCAKTLELMKQPIEISEKPAVKAGAVKKATRRLKIRTIIIFILVIAVAAPPAFSFINWYRGDGICFSNIDNIKDGKALMEVWKNDGFETFINTMAPDYLYEILCTEKNYFTKNPDDYTEQMIQGRPYYGYDIFDDKYAYNQEEYLQNFWYNIITETIHYYIVPADIYEELEKKYGEDFYKKRKSSIDKSVPKKISTEFGDFYYNYEEQYDNNVYRKYYRTVDFRDKVSGVYEIDDLFYIVERADVLTPELYNYYRKVYNDTAKWDKEYTDYYKNSGYDGFLQQWRGSLINYMSDYKDLQLTEYKLTDIYQATGEKEWNMIFSVKFSNGACGNIYIYETENGYCLIGAYPNELESEKSRDFFYGLAYTAHENYFTAVSYKDF